MVITCPNCVDGVLDGVPCLYCGGDSEIDLLDPTFRTIAEGNFRRVSGQVWSAILTKLDDNADKLDDLLDKCNDIFEKVNE